MARGIITGVGNNSTNQIMPIMESALRKNEMNSNGIISNFGNDFEVTIVDGNLQVNKGIYLYDGYIGYLENDTILGTATVGTYVYLHFKTYNDSEQIDIFEVISSTSTKSTTTTSLNSASGGEVYIYVTYIPTAGVVASIALKSIEKPRYATSAQIVTETINAAVTGTTQATSDNSDKIATTAFVWNVLDAGNTTFTLTAKNGSTTYTGTATIQKAGGIVHITLPIINRYCDTDLVQSLSGTIPSGYRPSETIQFAYVSGSGYSSESYGTTYYYCYMLCQINTSGVISVVNYAFKEYTKDLGSSVHIGYEI